MAITNQDKPTTGIPETYLNVGDGFNLLVGGAYRLIVGALGLGGMTNTTKVSIGETWGSATLSWNDEARTWLQISKLIGNSALKPVNSITNQTKP